MIFKYFIERQKSLCCVLGPISHSIFRMLEEKEEPGFLTGLKIPAPWAAGKTVETVHPVRDNYKFKETVHIPGARCLYLRFDNRCSSQYDYDKVSKGQLSTSAMREFPPKKWELCHGTSVGSSKDWGVEGWFGLVFPFRNSISSGFVKDNFRLAQFQSKIDLSHFYSCSVFLYFPNFNPAACLDQHSWFKLGRAGEVPFSLMIELVYLG